MHAPSISNGSYVVSLCFSPDGRFLATGGSDGKVRLWDALLKHKASVLTTELQRVEDIAFLADGTTLVCSGSQGQAQAQAFDVRSGRSLWSLKSGRIFSLALAPLGNTVALGILPRQKGKPSEIRICDVRTGKMLKSIWPQYKSKTLRVTELGFASDQEIIVVAPGFPVTVWSVQTGKLQRIIGGAKTYGRASLARSSNSIAVPSDILRIFNLKTGEVRQAFPQQEGIDVSALTWNLKGSLLAYAAVTPLNTKIRLWDGRTTEVKVLTDDYPTTILDVQSLRFSPDGKTLVAAYGSQLKFIPVEP